MEDELYEMDREVDRLISKDKEWDEDIVDPQDANICEGCE